MGEGLAGLGLIVNRVRIQASGFGAFWCVFGVQGSGSLWESGKSLQAS